MGRVKVNGRLGPTDNNAINNVSNEAINSSY